MFLQNYLRGVREAEYALPWLPISGIIKTAISLGVYILGSTQNTFEKKNSSLLKLLEMP